MKVLKFKKGLNDYLFAIRRSDNGFTWTPYCEPGWMSPCGDWMTVKHWPWYFLWWCFWFEKGCYNVSRARLKRRTTNL